MSLAQESYGCLFGAIPVDIFNSIKVPHSIAIIDHLQGHSTRASNRFLHCHFWRYPSKLTHLVLIAIIEENTFAFLSGKAIYLYLQLFFIMPFKTTCHAAMHRSCQLPHVGPTRTLAPSGHTKPKWQVSLTLLEAPQQANLSVTAPKATPRRK